MDDNQITINNFRAEVKHHVGGNGAVVAYWQTMREAAVWIGTWPDAVEAHVIPLHIVKAESDA